MTTTPIWRNVAGAAAVTQVEHVTLSDSAPTTYQVDLTPISSDVGGVPTGGGWSVSVEGEESFGLYDGQVSVISNSPISSSGIPAPTGITWRITLRFEEDALTPTLTIRSWASFIVYASVV